MAGKSVGVTRGAIEVSKIAPSPPTSFVHAGRIHETGPPQALFGDPQPPELIPTSGRR